MNQRYIYIAALLLLSACSGNRKDANPWSAFRKPVDFPVLLRDSNAVFFDSLQNGLVRWKKADVFNPAAILKNDTLYVLSRCEDNPAAALGGRTSRIGISASTDGIHFISYPEPVLYPARDSFRIYDFPGGCEDPRVVETDEGIYIMAYTAWNEQVPRLSIAFSNDLFHWVKKGAAFFRADHHRFLDSASKSASMITRMKNNRPILARINGRYWMYWGEHFVNLAWSENGYDWNPLLDRDGNLLNVMQTRPHYFDSDLVECGPPALITEKGVMLMYNGKNANSALADSLLPKGRFSTGRVFFDKKNLQTIRSRCDSPFLKPTLPHEQSGQYAAGTTFAEGLVFYKQKWFLYYGTADSYVGVAVSE